MTATVNIGKYRVLHQLASGGMGEIFLARHEGPAGFTKLVVVKRILPHLSRDPAFVKMFVNEAKLAALLQHPNVVQIFELGEDHGTWFIAMEPVLGHSLREVAERLKEQGRSFPPLQLARICAQVLGGLHYAHTLKSERGEPLSLVHRDVSPENVMIGFNGAVKLLDFGIAKAAVGATDLTAVGAVKGKYAYMSPEQLQGEGVDARSDVWAVGVLMYELLAGHAPFRAVSDAELTRLIEKQQPVPLADAAPDAPDEVTKVVGRALEKDKKKRFASAQQMGGALERWVEAQRTSLTNSQTSAFMRELYGAEADQVLSSVSTSGRLLESQRPELYLSSVSKRHTGKRPMTPRRRGLMFGLTAVGAFIAIVAGLVVALTPDPLAPPVPVVKKLEPLPLAISDADAGATADAPVPEPEVPPALDRPPPEDAAPLDSKVKKRGFGTLTLKVQPWAEVYEGRRRLGLTPMRPFELPVGRHVLTLKNPQLGVTRQVTVKVGRGAHVAVAVDLSE